MDNCQYVENRSRIKIGIKLTIFFLQLSKIDSGVGKNFSFQLKASNFCEKKISHL